jgi:general secretion pathway protein E
MPNLVKFFEKEAGIPAEKLQDCLKACRETNETMDKALVAKGLLSEKQMLGLMSRALAIPYAERLSDVKVPEGFVTAVPVHFARSHNLMAIGEEEGRLKVATCSPLDFHPMDELSSILKREVMPVLATRAEITALVNKAYQQKVDVVDEMLEDLDADDISGIARELEDSHDLLDMANKAPIIKLVNMMLFQALKMRASDVHIQPFEDKLQVRYRIDGILYDMMNPPKKIQEAIISRVKVMGKMDIAQRLLPQDGRASMHVGDSEVDVRISCVPTSHGERIVMRLLDKSARLYELEELGMDQDHLKLFAQYIRYSHGIIFVTGPTGSGKTTSLYAALKRINSADKNIITIEDPIEYHLPGLSQIEVSAKRGLTFATGLRTILRQDPNIIMVGEVRDLETATIAIQAALTGHLVFSTLHTNDSAGAMTRLLDLGVEQYLVASSVVAVMAQRLVRLVCKHCREEFAPEAESLSDIGLKLDQLPNRRLWKGRGCPNCLNTGYLDRMGIYEVLPVTEKVREQVMTKTGASLIKQAAVASGFRTLRMDGAQKVLRGLTTIDEVLRVTQMDVV